MTDDKTRQEGAPAADPIQEGAGREPAALEPPINDMDMRYKIMSKKWGSECVEDFIKKRPRVYEMIMRDLSAALTSVFKDMEKPMHEHTVHVIMRVTRRMIEIDISRALIAHLINHIQGINETAENFYTEYHDVFLHIEKEIEKRPEAPGHTGLKVQEIDVFFDQIGAEDAAAVIGGTFETVCSQILRDAAANARKDREAAERRAEYAPVQVQGTDKIEYPVDKPNNNFWDNAWRTLTESANGQLTFSFDMAKKGSKEELPLYLSINFDELQDIHITKKLTPFDKRVYIAVSALFNAGNTVISLSQIYKHMGYRGRPGATDIKRIHECVVKMMGAQISVDNALEAKSYPKYGHFTYRGVLLPVEIGELYDIQGALTDAAIHILKEPPLMTFARRRNQLTTVSLKLLQSPVSKTDANLAIDDYLIVQIKRAQKGQQHGKHRMLYKTIYKNTGIPNEPKTNTEKQQKKRAPGKIDKYLNHYQTEGTINHYTTEKDGVTVYW